MSDTTAQAQAKHDAASAMLAALKALTRPYDHDWKDRMAAALAAIAAAEAAGIK